MTDNALTAFLGGAPLPTVSGDAFTNALDEAADGSSSGSPGLNFLQFSGKTGIYALGQAKSELDPDQLYIVDPQTITRGFVCWIKSKPAARVEWSIFEPALAIKEADLEDKGPYVKDDGWKASLSFQAAEVSGLLTPLKFSSTSKSGVNAIADFMKEMSARAKADEPDIPVMSFGKEKFFAKEQWNFKPVLEVECWVTRDAAGAFFKGTLSEDDLLAGEEPKKAKKKKPSKRRK